MTPAVPESALERDQRIGLVSRPCNAISNIHHLVLCALTSPPINRASLADVRLHPQQRIREFLKVRTSYDVLPLSFRLIILDTSLLVKKSLSILIQNGRAARVSGHGRELICPSSRHRFGAPLGFEDLDICGLTYDCRLHQSHPILLAES